jgi:hypothetical protein
MRLGKSHSQCEQRLLTASSSVLKTTVNDDFWGALIPAFAQVLASCKHALADNSLLIVEKPRIKIIGKDFRGLADAFA